MNRDWRDFKALKGNMAGARDAFEDSCKELFRKLYPEYHVAKMRVAQGDGGIDIFIGNYGKEPIIVVQCKFFLDDFGSGQKQQIKDSFKKAAESEEFEVKEWILCMPYVFNQKENEWYFEWRNKEITRLCKENTFIQFKDGDELISLMKEYGIYDTVFEMTDSQNIQTILDLLTPSKSNREISSDIKTVLFNNYTERCNDYYYERDIDRSFKNHLGLNNIWVFGESGKGKTAFLNRNLIFNKIQFCYCDLSPLTIENADQILEEIILNIEDKFQVSRSETETNLIKQISELLIKECYKDLVIVIDELSVFSIDLIKDIIKKLTQLVVYYNNKIPDGNLKFIISTIHNPKHNSDNFPKATEYFQFISCDDWNNDLSKLFDLINHGLNHSLTEYKNEVIDAASNSPRILKSIFRKVILLKEINQENVSDAIKMVKSEIVS
ncbi:hypothetical protein BAZ12_18590 [Elizabethkingia miricola]|uniref:Restriction endonuclease type IV Mrr domain-containing protein n=1 Tax=Elizabethkingia miricola TaxID=172045 RepID=A0ABD4DKA5_ELIMR|nr:hypothetical protein [Elizabethkingia miricola]KUY17170.1 hypothetical protein ATB95_12380 [Elizabethkingia miricola]OPC72283.1 hypothetical protein BAZ13_06160 [Elizabethkingia miricola]OPC76024.1 hypothetical protein BAZ12_18590 [Elizabethkingia miricola]SPW31967.1 Uncharacterised protein [Elizabethkingia miricola]